MLNINANVVIGVTGLALSHYHSGTDNWEFLFPREVPDHHLKIKIVKHHTNGSVTTWHHTLPDTVKKIQLTSTAPPVEPTPKEKYIYPGEMEEKLQDGRRILDLSSSEFYGTEVKLRNKEHQKFTFLTIPRGTLYTLARPTKDLALTFEKNGEFHAKRRIAQTGGIDIQWAPGANQTEITDVTAAPASLIPNNFIISDPAVALYKVTFDNDCRNCDRCSESDFGVYNDLLIDHEAMGNVVFEVIAVSRKSLASETSFVNSLVENLQLFAADPGGYGCRDVPCFFVEASKTEIQGDKTASLALLL
jgi:hypothetical protein